MLYSTAATAARAEPMAKVREMVIFTLMPISFAASLSSETARMALPILVFFTKSWSRIIQTAATPMVIKIMEL